MSSQDHSVLFVCTANRIRSVMAEALFRELIRQSEHDDVWRIASAGTWATDGQPPMPYAIRAMAERGIDVSSHRSRSVDHTPLEAYSLILVMEHGHKESLTWEFPAIADRVYLITEMIGDGHEVTDPVMGTPQDHGDTADALQQLLIDGFDRIRTLSRDSNQPQSPS